MPLTIEIVQSAMPEIGQRMERELSDGSKAECVVTYVNTANLWYQVTFRNGIRMCYKLPSTKPFRYDHLMESYGIKPKQGRGRKVRVLEVDKEYPTVKECADALKVSATTLRRYMLERRKIFGQYTVVYAD